ncbi:MAG: hypothetical protein ACR2PG_05585, partial [Hyphomicrobiaceae bacterium]
LSKAFANLAFLKINYKCSSLKNTHHNSKASPCSNRAQRISPMQRKSSIAFLALTLALLPTPAFSYLDPAVGSMIFQGIIGAIAIAGTAWYTLRLKVSEYMKNTKEAFKAERGK